MRESRPQTCRTIKTDEVTMQTMKSVLIVILLSESCGSFFRRM
jgi:hypothetical protein